MPVPKAEFDRLHPADFYTPAELLEGGQMYTVYEIARLLQGLEPDAEIYEEEEAVLLDWAIPWIMTHADDLVVAEPRDEDEPGYYGLDEGEVDRQDSGRNDGERRGGHGDGAESRGEHGDGGASGGDASDA